MSILSTLRSLHLDRSTFSFARPDEWEPCCLCSALGSHTARLAYMRVQTVGGWGKWRDRHLCKACTKTASKSLPNLSDALNDPTLRLANLTPLEQVVLAACCRERLRISDVMARLTVRRINGKAIDAYTVSRTCAELAQKQVLLRYQEKPGASRYFCWHPAIASQQEEAA
ncbi:MAG TPA: hypothetical protein V6C63_14205 [Allocoleopsis sp.]